jgi:hypothetical protein
MPSSTLARDLWIALFSTCWFRLTLLVPTGILPRRSHSEHICSLSNNRPSWSSKANQQLCISAQILHKMSDSDCPWGSDLRNTEDHSHILQWRHRSPNILSWSCTGRKHPEHHCSILSRTAHCHDIWRLQEECELAGRCLIYTWRSKGGFLRLSNSQSRSCTIHPDNSIGASWMGCRCRWRLLSRHRRSRTWYFPRSRRRHCFCHCHHNRTAGSGSDRK